MKRKVALCVAEKPTVAKSVSEFLSRNRFQKVSIIYNATLNKQTVITVWIHENNWNERLSLPSTKF